MKFNGTKCNLKCPIEAIATNSLLESDRNFLIFSIHIITLIA